MEQRAPSITSSLHPSSPPCLFQALSRGLKDLVRLATTLQMRAHTMQEASVRSVCAETSVLV